QPCSKKRHNSAQLDNVGSKPTRLERPNGNKASRLLIRCIWVGQRALSSKMALQPLSVNETPKCNRNKSCEHISMTNTDSPNSYNDCANIAVRLVVPTPPRKPERVMTFVFNLNLFHASALKL